MFIYVLLLDAMDSTLARCARKG